MQIHLILVVMIFFFFLVGALGGVEEDFGTFQKLGDPTTLKGGGGDPCKGVYILERIINWNGLSCDNCQILGDIKLKVSNLFLNVV